MNDSFNTLQDLRGEIDAIDAELHGLIMRRGALVERIRAVKARDSIATVRPGREARILRVLAARHAGNFPFAAVARIWREIIAGITRMEMPEYAVAVYGAADDMGCWDLARNQFGSATPMTAYGTTREVLGEIAGNRATLGVLPCPREGDSDPWWTGLAAQNGLRVSYRLPFAPLNGAPAGSNRTEAFAIGHIVPEESELDRSLIVVEARDTLSRAGLTGLLQKVQISGQPIASHQSGVWFYLVEADGFVADSDPRIEDLARLGGIEDALVIGGYAVPLETRPAVSGPL